MIRNPDKKKIMINFSKSSSPKSRISSNQNSFQTHQNQRFSITPVSEQISADPHFTNSSLSLNITHKKPLNNFTLMNLLKKSSSKKPDEEKWYRKIFKVVKKNKIDTKTKLMKSLQELSPGTRLKRLAKFENFGYTTSDVNKKPKNFLVIVALVKKFIQVIKTYTFVKKIFRLKNFHFNVIGDIANYYNRGSEFGDRFFANITNRTSDNYVKYKQIIIKYNLFLFV